MTAFANTSAHTGVASGRSTTAFAAARRAAWTFLSEIGRSRARSEMLRAADRLEVSRPELAAQLRACALGEAAKA